MREQRRRRLRGERLKEAIESVPPLTDPARRALAVELQAAGRRRQELLEQELLELERVGELARRASKMGMSLSEVADLANVSRPTLYKLLDRP